MDFLFVAKKNTEKKLLNTGLGTIPADFIPLKSMRLYASSIQVISIHGREKCLAIGAGFHA